jgi:hypothetical protein
MEPSRAVADLELFLADRGNDLLRTAVLLTIGPPQNYFHWLRPIPANLAQLKESVPAGFRQVTPPAQK